MVSSDEGIEVWDVVGRRVLQRKRVGIVRSIFLTSDGRSLLTSGIPGIQRWPIAFEDISVAGLTKFLPEIVGPSIAEGGSARLLSLPNRNETVLQMVPPFMQPFVLGRTNNLAGARVAGLFPIPQAPREPPQALFDQLDSKENLVYYHWEITQNKLELYRMLHQLLAFFFQKTQMNSTIGQPAF